jgi:hypothetical protein
MVRGHFVSREVRDAEQVDEHNDNQVYRSRLKDWGILRGVENGS